MALVVRDRWAIEVTFQTSKDETGLDHYQSRQYIGRYRHVTLSILVHVFLSVIRANKRPKSKGGTLVRSSLAELRGPHNKIVRNQASDNDHVLQTSR